MKSLTAAFDIFPNCTYSGVQAELDSITDFLNR